MCMFLCIRLSALTSLESLLLDVRTIASLLVLSGAMITRCLCVCVGVFVRLCLFGLSIKNSHCVTAVCLLPSCFRGESKTGRIRGGMSKSREGTLKLCVNKRKRQRTVHVSVIIPEWWEAQIHTCWEAKHLKAIMLCPTNHSNFK